MNASLPLVTLAGAMIASADLLVYEPFDYPVLDDEVFGRLEGKNGGLGFGGPWVDSSGDNLGFGFIFDSRGNPEGLYGGTFGGGQPNWDGVVANLPTLGGYVGLSDWSNQGSAAEDKWNAHRLLGQSADALAGANGILWLSVVWHWPGSGFQNRPGIALTDGGGFGTERARFLTGNSDGIGIGNGTLNLWPSQIVNAVVWENGGEVAKTGVGGMSTSEDNIIVLKFEFGATDTVSAWSFTESQLGTATEATFNTNAGSASFSGIDETTLTTLAFSAFRKETAIDEIRLGDSFEDVITGTVASRRPLEIKNIVYDQNTDEITVTWQSNPGDSYGIYWSDDATSFSPAVNLDPAIEADATGSMTTYGPFPNPHPGAEELFLRIGLPDLEAPTLDRVWGNNSTISLDFSETIYDISGLDQANYTVEKSGGGTVAVNSVSYGPGPDTLRLTTATLLDLDADYTVTMNNLTDLAGRPLGNPTVGHFRTWDNTPSGIKVFVLAGQSNMVGYGQSEVGFGGVIGAEGSLRHAVDMEPATFGHLVDGLGNWIVRDDVKVWWNKAQPGEGPQVVKGNLDIGFASESERIGPEYGFGWVMGDYFAEPVLLIKAAWGGKSLYGDFRPPSAVASRGGQLGRYYVEMFEQVHEVLDNLDTEFPEWAGRGYQIVGFGWHQGWNDAGQFTAPEYEANLVDLINDLRDEFGDPALPVSVAAQGIGGDGISGDRLLIFNAQMAVGDPALHPEFTGTVFSADTRSFYRDASRSPTSQNFHWNQNGRSYYEIGDIMGTGMEGLLTP